MLIMIRWGFEGCGAESCTAMLALTLMKKPNRFDNKEITAERMAVFNNLIPHSETLVLGQYENYSQDKPVTDTFFAFKTELNSEEFKGVPIYVRSGKKLRQTVTEISIIFKNEADKDPNVLIFRIQPLGCFRAAIEKYLSGWILKINTFGSLSASFLNIIEISVTVCLNFFPLRT